MFSAGEGGRALRPEGSSLDAGKRGIPRGAGDRQRLKDWGAGVGRVGENWSRLGEGEADEESLPPCVAYRECARTKKMKKKHEAKPN